MQQHDDDMSFIVVHADGSLGSANYEDVFGPPILEDPQPQPLEPQLSKLSLEDAIDAEIDKEPAWSAPPKRAHQTQQTLDQVLRPKAKAKLAKAKAKASSLDVQKAFQRRTDGGPHPDHRSGRSSSSNVVVETPEADIASGSAGMNIHMDFWDVVDGNE